MVCLRERRIDPDEEMKTEREREREREGERRREPRSLANEKPERSEIATIAKQGE